MKLVWYVPSETLICTNYSASLRQTIVIVRDHLSFSTLLLCKGGLTLEEKTDTPTESNTTNYFFFLHNTLILMRIMSNKSKNKIKVRCTTGTASPGSSASEMSLLLIIWPQMKTFFWSLSCCEALHHETGVEVTQSQMVVAVVDAQLKTIEGKVTTQPNCLAQPFI